MTSSNQQLDLLRQQLKTYFVQRDDVVDGILVGLLSGEHVLLLGPVGTAKSMMARVICEQISGTHYFTWLLTKFSTPEEIFGPVSLKGLENDEFRRITKSKLPTAHIAFLDEIFKANSAILNSLLAVLNERIYHNGISVENVPLLSLVAASNEIPEEGELMALYDRFLIRFQVDYVEDDEHFVQLLKLKSEPEITASLSLDDLAKLRKKLDQITIPNSILHDFSALRTTLNQKSIEVSDRRYKKSLTVLRAYALLSGRRSVKTADLSHLEHVLWSEPEQQAEVATAIKTVIRRFEVECHDLREMAEEQHRYATRYWPNTDQRMAAAVEALAKLRRLLGRADDLIGDCEHRDDDSMTAAQQVRDQIAKTVDDLLQQVGQGQRQ